MLDIEKKIEFDKIKEHLKNYCVSSLGKSEVDSIVFLTDLTQINYLQKLTYEFISILNDDTFPLEYISDLSQSLERIKIVGTYLVEEELLSLYKNLETIKKLLNYFKKTENIEKYPTWHELVSQQKFYPIVLDIIRYVLTSDGQIKDTASPNLRRIRTEISDKQKEVSLIVKNTLVSAQKQGYVDQETTITIRNGRMLIPIDAANKNKINGIVQDYSATGKTLYIEPIKAVEINNQLTALYYEEKQEIIKILIDTTDKIRPYLDSLRENLNFLAQIDFTRSKAILSVELSATMPQISDKAQLKLNFAYNPVLFLQNIKQKKKTIPLDIELDDNQRIVLISGPNAGGKSIAIKTVGLLQYMHQCGMLIPAKDNSSLGIFDKIFIDIGDNQSTENDLSTYTSHLYTLKHIIDNANERSLVLLDEFGAGTDPAMGGAIAEAILRRMLDLKLKAVVNTHYSNLKIFASQNDGIVNAAMLFDYENLRPTYILEIGHPGSSFAFEIAQNIGLDKQIIDDAKNRAGKNIVDYDNIINQIEKEKRLLSIEKKQLQKTKAELSQKVIEYRAEKQKIVDQKRKIIEQTQKLLDEKFSEANKLIENTIRQIRENHADKTIVKELRKKFEQQKQEIKSVVKKELQNTENNKNTTQKDKKTSNETINIDDTVEIVDKKLTGKVLGIKDTKIIVLVGNVKTIVDRDKVKKIATPAKSSKINVNVQLESKPQFNIDIRGCNSSEAIEKLTKFIDTAIVSDIKVLSILHGTGDGILRNVVRQFLKNISEVEYFGDEDIRFGGQGITIVKLK